MVFCVWSWQPPLALTKDLPQEVRRSPRIAKRARSLVDQVHMRPAYTIASCSDYFILLNNPLSLTHTCSQLYLSFQTARIKTPACREVRGGARDTRPPLPLAPFWCDYICSLLISSSFTCKAQLPMSLYIVLA